MTNETNTEVVDTTEDEGVVITGEDNREIIEEAIQSEMIKSAVKQIKKLRLKEYHRIIIESTYE